MYEKQKNLNTSRTEHYFSIQEKNHLLYTKGYNMAKK